MSMFKLAFGGILAAFTLGNTAFGWIRAFDWLAKNAPAISGALMNPVVNSVAACLRPLEATKRAIEHHTERTFLCSLRLEWSRRRCCC